MKSLTMSDSLDQLDKVSDLGIGSFRMDDDPFSQLDRDAHLVFCWNDYIKMSLIDILETTYFAYLDSNRLL